MISSALPQSAILYQLPSILEPIALSALFPHEQPVEVELGSGDGSFLANYARQNPAHNFMGVERLLGRVRKTERKARRAGLANLKLVRIESSYLLRYLLPPNSITALHIYFPDPWPKRRHRHHRLVNEHFPALAGGVLTSGGVVYLRTDDADYFEQMQHVFSDQLLFRHTETAPELLAVRTDFERDFLSRGVQTRHAAYVCR